MRSQSQGFFCYAELLPKRCRRDLNPFGNKIFAVEFVQIAHITNTQVREPVNCFFHLLRGGLRAFFIFRHYLEEVKNKLF